MVEPPSHHPSSLAASPGRKPWLKRGEGECAYPVAGEGRHILSCCNPCGRGGYCAFHAEAMRGPVPPSLQAMEQALREFLA